MMKHILLSFLFLGTSWHNYAQIPQTEVRTKTLFNHDWYFSQTDHPNQREVDYEDAQWRVLDLPHDWSIEGNYTPTFAAGKNNGFFPEGLGWYRKHFTVDQKDRNKQFVIEFEGVFMNSQVWINGHYLGNRPYGYATFRYDLTNFLKFGEENVIAVRVDNTIPGADRWYHGSGIYRDVHLLKTNYVHFKHNGGVSITTPLATAEQAKVNVDYTILGSFFTDKEITQYKKNRWNRTKNEWQHAPKDHLCTIRSIIYDSKGKEVARSEKQESIRNYEINFQTSQEVAFSNPLRWSAETPHLYYLHSEIEYNGKVLDDVVTRFGVRNLEFRPHKGFFVNEQPTKLWGVCLHHEAGALGAAVPKKTWVYRLSKLKEMGCNAIRTAHNPFDPDFYAVCDSLGFYVKDESFDEWRCGWAINWTENNTGKAMNGYNHLFDQWAETDLRDLIKRDRNHPSIIMWGIGNEIPDYRHFPDAGKTAKKLYDIAKEEDPTRPITLGDNSSQTTHVNGVQDVLDILGFNYIERDFGTTMYDEIYAKRPEKLCFGSEVNKELKYHLAVRDHDYVIGGFIWTGIDYLGETKDINLRGWNTSLLDMTLNLRPDGALYACCWKNEPQVYITTSDLPADTPDQYIVSKEAGERIVLSRELNFSWNKVQGRPVYITVLTNCDEIELRLNGRKIGRKSTNKDTYRAEFEIPFKAGKLTAYGYRAGKRVAQYTLETTGEATQFATTAAWPTLARDGKDITIIEVELQDQKGRTVIDAQHEVQVEVSGGAKLIAIDSPNLYYKGNFKTDRREAQHGRLLITIQSNGKDLPTQLKLSATGIQTKTIEL